MKVGNPMDVSVSGYSHTQRAPMCLLLYGFAALALVTAIPSRDPAGIAIAGGVAAVLLLLAPAFHHLTVEDQGTALAIRFGPLPLFRTRVNYADIASTEVGTTTLIEGWGIHGSLRGGWVWNLWGWDCVVVRYKNGGTLRIGSDDAPGLHAFLQGKLAA